MAEDDESSMIGYDPLAWMHEQTGSGSLFPADNQVAVLDDELCSEQSGAADSLCSDNIDDTSLQSNPSTETDCEVELDAGIDELNEESQPMDLDVIENSEQINESSATVGNQVVLESIQSIQNVTVLHQKLQQILDTQEKIDIDASAVTQIDTATLQLLLIVKLSAVKSQKEVNIDFPSQKFIDAANLLGLAEMLSVDQTASGLF
jgi:ABC-type transporter Mla MlaB component